MFIHLMKNKDYCHRDIVIRVFNLLKQASKQVVRQHCHRNEAVSKLNKNLKEW